VQRPCRTRSWHRSPLRHGQHLPPRSASRLCLTPSSANGQRSVSSRYLHCLGRQELHALLTGSVDFSAWQGCHPRLRATYRLRSSRSCASRANSPLKGDHKSLRSDRPALFGEIITRMRGCHDRVVAGTMTSTARDLASLDFAWSADRSRKEKKRVGALVSPHSSLPIGFSTSSFRVNRNLSLCSPPFFGRSSRQPAQLDITEFTRPLRRYSDRKKASRSALWMAGRHVIQIQGRSHGAAPISTGPTTEPFG